MVICIYQYESESEVAQSCPTLCDPMDCSLSGSSFHGIFQVRVLEWIAISFFRGYSQPRNRTRVSLIAGRLFTVGAIREVHMMLQKSQMNFLANPILYIYPQTHVKLTRTWNPQFFFIVFSRELCEFEIHGETLFSLDLRTQR